MRLDPTDDLRRPLAIGGVVAWSMVAIPLLLNGSLAAWRLGVWVVMWLAFAASFAGAIVTTSRSLRVVLLALSVCAVVAMVLVLCDGFEGALLVLVALRLGGSVSRRAGIAWVIAQSALLVVAVAIHWSLPPAVLLAPPYFGFSLVAFFVADVLAGSALQRRALAAANAELRAAQGLAIENGRLAERVRIARDLHDAVGHRLTALGMNLEIASKLANGAATEPLATARTLAKAALADVRAIVERLRDDERIDLATTLRTLATEIPSPRVHLAFQDGACTNDPERAVAILRCTQEIITNAARHGRAQNLWIEIAEHDAGTVELSARDDGTGAASVVYGNGLRGMRERVESTGGVFEASSQPGEGFRIRATLPARRA